MAIITTIICRNHEDIDLYKRIIEQMVVRVLPETQSNSNQVDMHVSDGVLIAALGQADNLRTRDHAVLAGTVIEPSSQSPWWRTGGETPDGSFVLFRTGEGCVEAISDYAGSRTIWHARLNCGGVVMSTCLEIIVALFGNFELDDSTTGWYLSAGNCGPNRSWDRRIKPLPANTCLRAKRSGSAVNCTETTAKQIAPVQAGVDREMLANGIRQNFERLNLGSQKWLLALSGGYDSRAILAGLRNQRNMICVTWSDPVKRDALNSDVAVAKMLAQVTNHEHVVKVIERPMNVDQTEKSARRFMRYCDGRADNIAMYIDEMRIWKEISQLPAGGILRGDELFGTNYAVEPHQILRNMGLVSFHDFASSTMQRGLARRFGHKLPTEFQRRKGESTSKWRLRLRASYETPTIFSALAAVRSRYLETSSPLLSGQLVRLAEAMADKDLDDKRLYKSVVRDYFPDIGFSAEHSTLNVPEFLALPHTKALLQNHLIDSATIDLLGLSITEAASKMLTLFAISNNLGKSNIRRKISSTVLARWVSRQRHKFSGPPILNLRALALRSFLMALFLEEMAISAQIGARVRSE